MQSLAMVCDTTKAANSVLDGIAKDIAEAREIIRSRSQINSNAEEMVRVLLIDNEHLRQEVERLENEVQCGIENQEALIKRLELEAEEIRLSCEGEMTRTVEHCRVLLARNLLNGFAERNSSMNANSFLLRNIQMPRWEQCNPKRREVGIKHSLRKYHRQNPSINLI